MRKALGLFGKSVCRSRLVRLGLFCRALLYVSLGVPMRLRLEVPIKWHSTRNRLYHMTHELWHMTTNLRLEDLIKWHSKCNRLYFRSLALLLSVSFSLIQRIPGRECRSDARIAAVLMRRICCRFFHWTCCWVIWMLCGVGNANRYASWQFWWGEYVVWWGECVVAFSSECVVCYYFFV